MNEHRRAPRKTAYMTIPITNLMTDKVIGRVGNLSGSGMLMVCDHEIADSTLLDLSFEIANGEGHRQSIHVGAQEQWSERANLPGQFWTGLHFIDISAQDLEVIESWLGDLKD